VDLGGIPHPHLSPDLEPRTASSGLPQTLGPPAPLRPRCGCHGGVQKKFPAKLAEIAAREAEGKAIEIWFQDEARVGQKNKITRRWAKRGARPSAPHDQRTHSAYIFGAICPKEGKGAGLVLPRCNSEAMSLHLQEISRAVKPGAHAVVILDQAGWHGSKRLHVPDNITLLPLPPRSPELNPVENVWQFIRDNWLSNRIFKSYSDNLEHCR
jgi:transposase